MQFVPNNKDMFVKVTDTLGRSSQNIFDILKQVISVYQIEKSGFFVRAQRRYLR